MFVFLVGFDSLWFEMAARFSQLDVQLMMKPSYRVILCSVTYLHTTHLQKPSMSAHLHTHTQTYHNTNEKLAIYNKLCSYIFCSSSDNCTEARASMTYVDTHRGVYRYEYGQYHSKSEKRR